MRTKKLLLSTTLATGLFMAGGWSITVASEDGYSFDEADTDKSGSLSQEEYDTAAGGMRAELEQFKSKDPSLMVKETAPAGSDMEKDPGAEPTGFKSQDASTAIRKVAPTGSEAPAPDPGAEPTGFEGKSESIKSE